MASLTNLIGVAGSNSTEFYRIMRKSRKEKSNAGSWFQSTNTSSDASQKFIYDTDRSDARNLIMSLLSLCKKYQML